MAADAVKPLKRGPRSAAIAQPVFRLGRKVVHIRGLALQETTAGRGLPLQNECERNFEDLARRNGWVPTKRGWPDFICFGPEGEVIAVEVKPRTKSGRLGKLKQEQIIVMEFLTSKGIRCFVSDGQKLEPYSYARHGTKARPMPP